MDFNQPVEQAGFWKGYSTVDHIQTVGQILEKMREYNIEAHLVFVDYQKAFDTISHENAWYALAAQGIPKKAIDTIQNLYYNATTYIKLDKIGEKF